MALNIEQKLALNVYKLDKEAHITIDKEVCRRCGNKICLRMCPAHLFTLNDKGDVEFNYEGCLECGTCLISCIECGLEWNHPRGGFGVEYRFG